MATSAAYRIRSAHPLAFLAWLVPTALFGLLVVYIGLSLVVVLAGIGIAVGAFAVVRWPVQLIVGLVGATAFWNTARAYGVPLPRYGMTLIVALGFAATTVQALLSTARRERVTVWPATIVLVAFLIGVFLSIPYAPTLRPALQGYLREYVPWVLFLGLAYSQLGDARRLSMARGIVAVIALTSAYACLRYAIGPSVRELANASSSNDVGGGEVALFGSFAGRQELGGWVAIALPFALAMGLVWRDRWRLVAFAGVAMGAVATFGANTRIATLSGGLGLFMVLALAVLSRSARGRFGVLAATVVGVVFIGGVAFTLTVTGGEKADRYSRLLTPDRDIQFSQRQEKWRVVGEDLHGKPFGYGIGTAGSAQIEYGKYIRIENSSIDNSYLTISYQFGYAVAFVFLLIMLGILYTFTNKALAEPDPLRSGLAAAAAGGLTAWLLLLTAGLYLERFCTLLLVVILGISAGVFTTGPRGLRG